MNALRKTAGLWIKLDFADTANTMRATSLKCLFNNMPMALSTICLIYLRPRAENI
jgi:hypothetical protein